ncbi:b(0,+)-type amino acid transporter 1-like [Cherax quadricarinatus]|uniref:b(0,+)-type amino acid transporter 1-like n=1 Tax=Cherax quadricarinatus TaxID=27406 RepID=UPI00387E4B0F
MDDLLGEQSDGRPPWVSRVMDDLLGEQSDGRPPWVSRVMGEQSDRRWVSIVIDDLLATMIPESGGIYTYIRRTLGPTPGFVYLWMALIIEEPTMRVVDGYTFGYYILQPFFPHDPPVVPIKLLAAVLIVFLAWVNCCAVKVSVALQDVLMIPKILILGSIIITGIYRLVTDPSSSYEEPFQGTCLALPVIATAFYQGLYTYDGWWVPPSVSWGWMQEHN